MGLLTREAILAAEDVVYDVVDVPEWGGSIRIKSLRGTQVDAYQQSRIKSNGNIDIKKAKAQLVMMAAVDDEGKRLFSQPDIDRLAEKSNKALERSAAAISKLSGMKTTELDSEMNEPDEERAESLKE